MDETRKSTIIGGILGPFFGIVVIVFAVAVSFTFYVLKKKGKFVLTYYDYCGNIHNPNLP